MHRSQRQTVKEAFGNKQHIAGRTLTLNLTKSNEQSCKKKNSACIKQRNGPKNEIRIEKVIISVDGASHPWSCLKIVAADAEGRLVARKHFI